MVLLGHDLLWPNRARTGGLSLSASAGYGDGWDFDTVRWDLQAVMAYHYKHMYLGLGVHDIRMTANQANGEIPDWTYTGAELLAGFSLPLYAERGLWLRLQGTYMPYLRYESEERGGMTQWAREEDLGSSGSTEGMGYDVGLSYRRGRWWMNVGFRAVQITAGDVVSGISLITDSNEDFAGPYVEAGVRW